MPYTQEYMTLHLQTSKPDLTNIYTILTLPTTSINKSPFSITRAKAIWKWCDQQQKPITVSMKSDYFGHDIDHPEYLRLQSML